MKKFNFLVLGLFFVMNAFAGTPKMDDTLIAYAVIISVILLLIAMPSFFKFIKKKISLLKKQ